MNHPRIQMIFRAFIVLVITVIGLFFFYHLLRLTYPFLIATVFVLLIKPLIHLLEKYVRLPRPMSVLISILFLFVAVGGIVTYIIFKIIDGVFYLSEQVPAQILQISEATQAYFNDYILPLWDQGIGLLNNLEPSLQTLLQEGIQQIGGNLASLLGTFGQAIASGISSFIGALPITFTVIVFTILAIYFISKDWNKYAAIYRNYMPLMVRKQTVDVLHRLRIKFFGFLKSQIILMFLTAIVSLIGLFILQADRALTIAVILGVIDLIPYIGPGGILIPWSIYNFATGDIFMGVGLLILYAATVTVRQFAEPKVLSSSMKLNPLAILVSLFAGLKLFGIFGLVLGPILLVLIISLYETGAFNGLWRFIKEGK